MATIDSPGEKYIVSDDTVGGCREGQDASPGPEQLDASSEDGMTMTGKLRVKMDLMIIPMVSLMYMFCFIDRINIGMDHPPSLPLILTLIHRLWDINFDM